MNSSEKAERERQKDEEEEKSDETEEKFAPIIMIAGHHLLSRSILTGIYDDLYHHYYAMKDWSTETYVLQACLGFIAVSFGEEYLLPEIQKTYCVLDWKHLHFPHGPMKRLEKKYQNLSLRINYNLEKVLQGIDQHHAPNNWVNVNYKKVLTTLSEGGEVRSLNGCPFQFLTVELWHTVNGEEEMIAGEIGYRVGSIYTSLTGFSTPAHPSSGFIQLLALAVSLRNQGFAFWNLGHPPRADGAMKYKADLGGVVIPRKDFLQKWNLHSSHKPVGTVSDLSVADVRALLLLERKSSKRKG